MAKHASKFAALQVLEPLRTTAVQVPLPMLDVLSEAHNAFFDYASRLAVRSSRL